GVDRPRGMPALRRPSEGRHQDRRRERRRRGGGGGPRPSPRGQGGARRRGAAPDARRERRRVRGAAPGRDARSRRARRVRPRVAGELQGSTSRLRDRRDRRAAHGHRKDREARVAPRGGAPGAGVIAMPQFETVVYEVTDHVAALTLTRPDTLNAMNQVMKDELRECRRLVKNHSAVWVAIIT